MEDILKIAQDSGMSQEQGETATGGLMAFVKNKIPADQFAQLSEKIPGLDGAVEKYGSSDKAASGGGAGGMFGGAMSSLTGGGGGGGGGGADSLPGLLTSLTSKGINPAQMQSFLPQVSTLCKEEFGVDISQYVGGAAAGGGDAAASSGGGGASDLMGSAMGMFGK